MIYTIKQKFFDSLIIFMSIMSAGGLLFVFNRNVSYMCFLLLLFITIFFLGKKINRSQLNSNVITFLSISFLFTINYIFAINDQGLNKYLYYIMVVLTSILVLFHFINNRSYVILVDRIYWILRLIVLHAFLSFLAFFFIKNSITIITSTHHECETFLNIFFYTTERGLMDLFGFEFCRNQGLFWEPGVLQGFLNMFFFLEAFIFRKSRSLLLLTAIVILTTYSTTGIALLLVQSAVFLFSEFKKNKWLIPFIFLLSIPIYIIFSINVEDKIQGEKQASFQKRYFDLVQPFFIALEYPLTGIGLDIDQFQRMRQEFYFSSSSLKSLQEQVGIESNVTSTSKGSSNSIMFLFATMGIPTSFLMLYMFFNQQIIKEKRWLWMLIMVVSVMSEPLLLRPFFFLFIVSGFTYTFYKITSFKHQII